jgi:hypothetical protein
MGASSRDCRGAGPAAGDADVGRPQRVMDDKMHYFATSARREAREDAEPRRSLLTESPSNGPYPVRGPDPDQVHLANMLRHNIL